jgi:trimethylamine--corrinoid protein Co-methyltransferase
VFHGIRGLTEDQIGAVQRASEELLETQGFRVTHAGLKRLCRKAGAVVDTPPDTLRFPTPLLRELLAGVPSCYEIADCRGRRTPIGGEGQVGIGIVTDPWIIDYGSRQPRRPRLDDIRRHTTIQQRLPFVKCTSRMDFPVSDVDGPTSSLRALEEWFLLQDKHLAAFVTSMASFEQYLDVGRILLQGKPLEGSGLMTVAVAPLSPLRFTDLNAELLLRSCELGFPVVPTVCPMAGATAPYTLAGTLLMGHVENLFVAALSQVARRGQPFLYAFGPSVASMRSGHDQYYTLDKVLWKVAGVQLGKSCGWPTAAECGGSMTHCYDQQNGAEGMLFMLAAHASGANVLAGFGSTYNAIGMSAEMIVIHTAWLEAARFLARGIPVDAQRLAVDSIRAVGSDGSYLTDDLTLEFLRRGEFFGNGLFDFAGGFEETRPLLERAHQKAEELAADPVSPHPEAVQAGIREYFARLYSGSGGAPTG